MRPFHRVAPLVLGLAALVPAAAEATGSITGVSSNPSPAAAGAEVTITLAGSGTCQTYVTFGDNQKSARLTQLPATVKHTYAAPGKYVIRSLSYRSGNEAPGLSPCGGFADMELTVNAKAQSKAHAPKGSAAVTGPGAPSGVNAGPNLSFQKIEVAQPAAKSAAQDNWQTSQQTTPSPTPTKTAK